MRQLRKSRKSYNPIKNNETYENLRFPYENHENHENHIIPLENYANHMNPRIPRENRKKNKSFNSIRE